jgi:hypothetical protein
MGYGSCQCCGGNCGFYLFDDGSHVLNPYKLTYSPAGTESAWGFNNALITEWVYLKNAGYAATPAGSVRTTIRNGLRRNAQDFQLSFYTYPNFDGVTSVSQQIGMFVADAFAVWIDYTDWTLRYDTTDSVGTLPSAGSGTVIHTFDAFPFELPVRVAIYKNEKGTWNLQFRSHLDTTNANINYATVFDVDLPGLDAGAITVGVTVGTGGGAVYRAGLTCAPYNQCNQCWDGLPTSWTKSSSPSGDILTDPTSLPSGQACTFFGGGALQAAITTVRSSASDVHTLLTSNIFWQMYLTGGYGTTEMIVLTASVQYRYGLGDLFTGTVIVAAWVCPWSTFCCYGASAFTKTRLLADGTDLGGSSQFFYYEQYSGWQSTITITADGPPGDMPCTQTCTFLAVKDPITHVLSWQQQNDYSNQHPYCAGDAACPSPPFDPSHENQWAYVSC